MTDVRTLEQEASDAVELWELANAEGDEATLGEIAEMLRGAVARASEAELKALLSGEVDGNDCYVEIHAGAGGTESRDWASMLADVCALGERPRLQGRAHRGA